MPIIKELQTFYSCKGNTFQPYFHPYPILIFYVKKPRTKVFLTLEFTKKVLETAKGFNSMDFSDAIKFCKFLYEWILSHIAHEDKLYVKKVLEYKKI